MTLSQQKKAWIVTLVVFAILMVIAVKTNRPSPSTQEETTTGAERAEVSRDIEQPTKGGTEFNETAEDKSDRAPDSAPHVANATAPAEESKPKRLPRFVEIGAKKCIPCRMMQPILDDLRKEYAGKLQVDFVDVWEHPEQGDKYGIQQIPTQVIYDSSGKEVFRHIGFYPKDEILAKFKELGIDIE